MSRRIAPSPSARRVAAHRRRMREAGFVQRTVWVANVKDAEYRARIDREIAALAAEDPAGNEAMAALAPHYDWPDEADDSAVR